MSNPFFILIDKRDSEKFRQFKIRKFNEGTKQILEKNNQNYVWSFHKSQINCALWKQIKKNDIVCFSIPKNRFQIVAKISKKLIDKKLGKLMWPKGLNSEQITHFLLFENLENMDVPFSEIINNSKESLITLMPGIYKINNSSRLGSKLNKISAKQYVPKPFFITTTKNGPAQKNSNEVTRFQRDSSKVKKLKKLYGDKCQICSHTFEYKINQFYSEVHHYNPLKDNADDDFDNMIVVCPNHHAEFDYNLIAIDVDGKSIIDRNSKKIAEIHFHKQHKLSEKNIASQLKGM